MLFEYQQHIRETDIDSINIQNDLVYITIKGTGIKLLLDPDDRRFIPIEIINFGSVEADNAPLIFNLASKCRTVFDIGANIGWYTLNFGKIPSIENIYSFEPIPYTFAYLKRHVEMNGINNAEIFNLGFSNEDGVSNFYWTSEETGSSSMRNIRERAQISEVKCKVVKLDSFVEGRSVKIDFIKCDVEGAELLVFQGALETLKRDKPIIFAEMLRKWSKTFNYHPNDLIHILASLGYYCYVARSGRLVRFSKVDGNTVETNYFFLHKDSSFAKQ